MKQIKQYIYYLIIFLALLAPSIADAYNLTVEEQKKVFFYENHIHEFPQYAGNIYGGDYIGDIKNFTPDDKTEKYVVTITDIKPTQRAVDRYKNISSSDYLFLLKQQYEKLPFLISSSVGAITAIAVDQKYNHNETKTNNASTGAYIASYMISSAISDERYRNNINKNSGAVLLPAKEIHFVTNGNIKGRFIQFNHNLKENLKIGDKLELVQKDYLWFFNYIY